MRKLIWLVALCTAVAAAGLAPVSAYAVVQPGVGTPIILSGTEPAERMSVTPTQVVAPAQPASEFDQPPAGHNLVAVQFQLTNVGSAQYEDSPYNSATLIDAQGQRYTPTIVTGITAGPMFPGSVKIAPGGMALGFLAFETPAGTQISAVQFTLDSGFGPDTGEWTVTAGGTEQTTPQTAADPAALVTAYFDAINNRDYQLAWELGGRSFDSDEAHFAAGFATTAYDTPTITGVSGETVSVVLDAAQTDGTHQYYAGTYTVHEGVIVAADIRRTG
jgi:hypothetical protein